MTKTLGKEAHVAPWAPSEQDKHQQATGRVYNSEEDKLTLMELLDLRNFGKSPIDKQAVNVRQIKKHQDSDSSDDEKKKQSSQDTSDMKDEVISEPTSPNPLSETQNFHAENLKHAEHEINNHPKKPFHHPPQQNHHSKNQFPQNPLHHPHHKNHHQKQDMADNRGFEDRLVLCSSVNEELHSKKPGVQKAQNVKGKPRNLTKSSSQSRDSLKHELTFNPTHRYDKVDPYRGKYPPNGPPNDTGMYYRHHRSPRRPSRIKTRDYPPDQIEHTKTLPSNKSTSASKPLNTPGNAPPLNYPHPPYHCRQPSREGQYPGFVPISKRGRHASAISLHKSRESFRRPSSECYNSREAIDRDLGVCFCSLYVFYVLCIVVSVDVQLNV